MDGLDKVSSSLAELGVRPEDSFQTTDLYESRQLGQVLLCLGVLRLAIAAHVQMRATVHGDEMRAALREEETLFSSVVARVRKCELSRAARQLTLSPMAPVTPET